MKYFSLIHYFIIFSFLLTFTYSPAHPNNDWFPLMTEGESASSIINMSAWLDKPAGVHGFVRMDGDRLVFDDGTPVKFWGTNIAGNKPFMPRDEAIKWADFLSRYGFNAVRFHKFTWEATDGVHSTRITEDKWCNFDDLCHELRQKGVYYGWSHIYGHRLLPGDSSRVLAYREIADTRFPWAHLNGSTASLVNFAEDLQALNIELTVNMLNHINPHTGLRYADDPALIFVEFQNEDNIFWSAIERTLEQTPTYRRLLCAKFGKWLQAKYGSSERWLAAWGHEGLSEGDSFASVYPQPNHGLFSWEYEQAIEENRLVKRHILDKAAFLYEEQVHFYQKFEQAVRETGYRGPIVASCWQAGHGLAHLLNLHADYKVGIIDRHNYFGGGSGHTLKPGPFDNAAMVSRIGSGLFGTGLQQVSDRPFAFSEWMSLIPNEWTAESAPIIAIYGMGLQGWDASYVFATDHPHYTSTIQTPWGGIYNACSPTQLALYPALAAMIYRGDVIEGGIVVNRSVRIADVLDGDTRFREEVVQDHDRKELQSSARRALAAGRVVVTFGDSTRADELADLSALMDEQTVASNTGQLRWSEEGRGFFTVNTPGTQGVVGFAPGRRLELWDVTLTADNEFAVILVSSLEKAAGLHDAKSILVTAVARAKNSGMTFNEDRSELLSVGGAPVLIEPVKFSLAIKRDGKPKVTALDHLGRRTATTLPVRNRRVEVDGSARTFYYLIEY